MKAKSLKTIARVLVLGVTVLAFAGAAHAVTYINLYGATAQFNFWSNYDQTFLTTPFPNGPGCTYQGTFKTKDGKSAVAVGTGCNAAYDGAIFPPGGAGAWTETSPTAGPYTPDTTANTIYFSYTNKASWDGIEAALGYWDAANQGKANPCPAGNLRAVATCNYASNTCTGTVPYVCQQVSIGTSDVESDVFTQTSTGTQYGPVDSGDAPITRSFPNNFSVFSPPAAWGVAALDASNHYVSDAADSYGGKAHKVQQPETPIAYPFGFFVNKNVTSYRCSASSAQNAGSLCLNDEWCTGSGLAADEAKGGLAHDPAGCVEGTAAWPACATGTYCQAYTIDNLSRLQVVALFTPIIGDWSAFDPDFWPALPITLCLRHAGSGTSATLDYGIMKGNGWGNKLYGGDENRACGGDCAPYIYYNDGTSDLLNCLSWANGDTPASPPGTGPVDVPDQIGGAIGYADSDNPNTADYVQVKFNGVFSSRYTMRQGIYDNFWTINRMYVPNNLDQQLVDLYADMLGALANPANINSTTLGTNKRYEYYGSSTELQNWKSLSTKYPYISGNNPGYVAPPNPPAAW
jgi:hypothetical protein